MRRSVRLRNSWRPLSRFGVSDRVKLGAPQYAQAGLGISHIARHAVDEVLQRMRSLNAEKARAHWYLS